MRSEIAANMLVLNTHLDSLVALNRFKALCSDSRYDGVVDSGRRSTRRVLVLRTAEALYRVLFAAIALTLLPTDRARRLPRWKRAAKRLGWKYLIPLLPAIKSRYPRLVMPGGYIDRELSLHTWAYDYHSINVMDLLRYHQQFGEHGSACRCEGKHAFAQRVDLPARWAESPGTEYALGFWAEALYRACLIDDDLDLRWELGRAILRVLDLGLGLPPSLLGANAEASGSRLASGYSGPTRTGLVVVDLARTGSPELLAVNVGKDSTALPWPICPSPGPNLRGLGRTDHPSTVPPAFPPAGSSWDGRRESTAHPRSSGQRDGQHADGHAHDRDVQPPPPHCGSLPAGGNRRRRGTIFRLDAHAHRFGRSGGFCRPRVRLLHLRVGGRGTTDRLRQLRRRRFFASAMGLTRYDLHSEIELYTNLARAIDPELPVILKPSCTTSGRVFSDIGKQTIVLVPGGQKEFVLRKWSWFPDLAQKLPDVAVVGIEADLDVSNRIVFPGWLRKLAPPMLEYQGRAWRAARVLSERHDRPMRFPNHVKNYIGQLTLPDTAALLSQAGAVVTNDCGLAHVAIVVGTPTFVIMGPSSRRKTSRNSCRTPG